MVGVPLEGTSGCGVAIECWLCSRWWWGFGASGLVPVVRMGSFWAKRNSAVCHPSHLGSHGCWLSGAPKLWRECLEVNSREVQRSTQALWSNQSKHVQRVKAHKTSTLVCLSYCLSKSGHLPRSPSAHI